MRMWVRSLVLLSGLMIRRCCELCCRLQMWLGSLIAMALAQAGGYSSNWTPSWEPPYATGVALKRQKDKNKQKNWVWYMMVPDMVSGHSVILQRSWDWKLLSTKWVPGCLAQEWPLSLERLLKTSEQRRNWHPTATKKYPKKWSWLP